MLVKPFEDQARTRPDQIAVKTVEEALTYEELEKRANRLAHFINREAARLDRNLQTVAMLFNHDISMIIGILAALKAGRCYVPLSPGYPYRRLAFMISDSESLVILTESCHQEIAGKLASENKILYLNIHDSEIDACPDDPPPRETDDHQNAYILYTSGSTGWPRGVLQTQENVLYYTRNWTQRFSISREDRMTLFSSFCHDGSVQDMFGALHNGAALYLVDVKNRQYTIELSQYLVKEKITIWHSVPSLYSYFVNSLTGKERFPDLRFILLGGEALRENEIVMLKKYFPHCTLANVYGQTESSVNSIWLVHPGDSFDKMIIGEPLDNTGILLMDEEGAEPDPLDIGEIIVNCPHLSPGYWKDEAATRQSFRRHPEYGLLYRTGDLGRLLLDGSIEFIGRKDTQVKIRGYRVELGEIESRLLEHDEIREAAVSIHQDKKGDIHLCAYIAAGNETKSRETPNNTELREYLAQYLPDYMIPAYFVSMERLPLTASGKINRKALPEPKIEIQSSYTAPRSPIEKKLVEMWSEILAIEKERIGIDMNFFELGGQSLKATTLVLKIHQSLDVILPLANLFKTPSIRDLAKHIQGLTKNKYGSIEPAEEKEYYPLSSSQKRLYILQQMETQSIGYNMSKVFHLAGDIDKEKLDAVFKKLVSRHESLRTSFEMMAEEPVQRVHKDMAFEIEYYDAKEVEVKVEVEENHFEGTWGLAPLHITPLFIKKFIRHFDLSRAPLLRVGIIRLEENNHILLIDQHHITTDGTSQAILRKEFAAVYDGKELEPLRIRYKDYARWLDHEKNKNWVKNQEAYWLDEFKEQVQPLNLPLDYSRPVVQSFEGSTAEFAPSEKETKRLKKLAADHGATLFMVLLTIFNVLLSKLTGQEDIVVGTPTAGRRHAELESIVGMFVNTLVLRNYPAADMGFNDFLKNVKERTLQAFENQDYPFEILVDKVSTSRDLGRNPLFDVMFAHHSQQLTTPPSSSEVLKPAESHQDRENHGYQYQDDQSKFDLVLASLDVGDRVNFAFGYRTKLFKKETIQRFVKYFKEITAAVTNNENGEILLKDIKISHELREVKSRVYESIESQLEF